MPDISSIINDRVTMQLGSMLIQIIQLNAEKEAAEKALAAAQAKPQAKAK